MRSEEYSLGSTGVVSLIEVHGLAGNDSLYLVGTPGVDNTTLHPGTVSLVGPGITVTGDSLESIHVASGGGQDRANLWDSVGDDQYTAQGDQSISDPDKRPVHLGHPHRLPNRCDRVRPG